MRGRYQIKVDIVLFCVAFHGKFVPIFVALVTNQNRVSENFVYFLKTTEEKLYEAIAGFLFFYYTIPGWLPFRTEGGGNRLAWRRLRADLLSFAEIIWSQLGFIFTTNQRGFNKPWTWL